MPLLKGLTGATYTPMHTDGTLNTAMVPDYVNHLIEIGLNALYVCGSTGEGISLTTEERMQVAEAFQSAAAGRVPVVIQVGSNSLTTSRRLAAHAAEIGAAAISANAPSYFKVSSPEGMVDCMAEIASAAPDLPFYYYHIPMFTGAAIDMIEFLKLAEKRIDNLAGIKYTDMKIFEYMDCLNYGDGRFEILWGLDEMLLAALAVGAEGGIGSTYAQAPQVYQQIIACWQNGNITEARTWQLRSWEFVKVLNRYGNLHAAQKAVLKMHGYDLGPCRLPIPPLPEDAVDNIRRDLVAIGYFDWAMPE